MAGIVTLLWIAGLVPLCVVGRIGGEDVASAHLSSWSLTASVGALQPRPTPAPTPDFDCVRARGQGAFEPVVLTNKKGMRGTMIAYGATMTHLTVPNRMGSKSDVLLGWDNLEEYCSNAEHTYFGATVGRVANRIKKCEFPLGGHTYNLSCNEKQYDTLHGGAIGFDRRIWTVVSKNMSSVTWAYLSHDGEMGFPGNLRVDVTHTITDDNEWVIKYSATTDKATPVALTNHAYFNLNANVNNTLTVLEHVVTIPHGSMLQEVSGPPDYHLIATGKAAEVAAGSPWDFSSPKAIGKDINDGSVTPKGGYDNAWIFSDWQQGMASRPVVTVTSALTGISLAMSTNQPSVQLYSGNFLNGTDSDAGSPSFHLRRKASQSYGDKPQYYHWRGAFTLEAQQYIDAVNHPNFPSVVLQPGSEYTQHTSYAFSVLK